MKGRLNKKGEEALISVIVILALICIILSIYAFLIRKKLRLRERQAAAVFGRVEPPGDEEFEAFIRANRIEVDQAQMGFAAVLQRNRLQRKLNRQPDLANFV